ncbi:MAG TPA: hypothetical protein PL012_00425 [Candidatus Obscuribacter sp.]|nr:hypothetical protein [Candidatus Obscuribacter sp.]
MSFEQQQFERGNSDRFSQQNSLAGSDLGDNRSFFQERRTCDNSLKEEQGLLTFSQPKEFDASPFSHQRDLGLNRNDSGNFGWRHSQSQFNRESGYEDNGFNSRGNDESLRDRHDHFRQFDGHEHRHHRGDQGHDSPFARKDVQKLLEEIHQIEEKLAQLLKELQAGRHPSPPCGSKPGGGSPEVPTTPDTPDIPPVPSQPDSPNIPGTPDIPPIPSQPDSPNVPGTPDIPPVPSQPDSPNTPSTPDSPSIPGLPDSGDFPPIPGLPDNPIPSTDNPQFEPPPAGYGKGVPFPDKGKTPAADAVIVKNTSDVINQLEQSGKVDPSVTGRGTIKATEPQPEIWIKLTGPDGSPMFISQQQVMDSDFSGSIYKKDSSGKLKIEEAISFDPYAEYHHSAGLDHHNPELYYRSTDGNLRPLEGATLKATVGGGNDGHPQGAFYDISYTPPKDMAFVRQEWTDGINEPGKPYESARNLEKVLYQGKMVSWQEAARSGLLYGAPL